MIPNSPLGLRVPEQSQASADAFILDPEKTKAWVANLPLANVGETSRRVFKAIVECNRCEMPDATRLKVVELLCAPANYVLENLEKHYIGAAFPLTPKSRKIAVLSRELQVEMAIAYKIIVRNILANNKGPLDEKLLVIAIYRALSYLSASLLRSYLAYESYAEGTWREIHRISTYTFQNKLYKIPVKKGKDRTTGTVNDLYVETLLLALAAPYKLRQQEIRSVAEKVVDWSKQARLVAPQKIKGLDEDIGLFFTDLWSDSPPVHFSLRADRPMKHVILLDTRRLVKYLHALRNESESDSQGMAVNNSDPDKPLLGRLIRSWSTAPKRRHGRTQLNFQLKVAVGIDAIFNLMSSSEKVSKSPAPEQKPAAVRDKEWKEQTDMLEHTLKSGFLKTSVGTDLSLSPLDDSEPSGAPGQIGLEPFGKPAGALERMDTRDVWTSHNPSSYETHVFRTVDESAGGYCISWAGKDIPRITVGELVGIQSATNATQFGAAIVRWMKNTPSEGLQLGMQTLAPNIVAVQATAATRNGGKTQQCMLLPELKATSQATSLIVPPLSFQIGDIVLMKNGESEQRIRLSAQLEVTGAFSQFLFKPLNKNDNDSPSGDAREPEKQFDSIWSTL